MSRSYLWTPKAEPRISIECWVSSVTEGKMIGAYDSHYIKLQGSIMTIDDTQYNLDVDDELEACYDRLLAIS